MDLMEKDWVWTKPKESTLWHIIREGSGISLCGKWRVERREMINSSKVVPTNTYHEELDCATCANIAKIR